MCKESRLQTGRGKLIIVSGFSGVGKGTLMKGLLAAYPGQYVLSVSVTTRAPREGEVDGISYHFKSQEEFDRLIEEGYFVEYARYTDNSYGTPRPYVEEHLAEGRNVILEIELQGALQVRKMYPDVKMIFVTTKDTDTMLLRLKGRGTETPETIRKRMTRAIDEADGVDQYQHIIINDELTASVQRMHEAIHQDGPCTPSQEQLDLIASIQSDLKHRLFQ